LPAASPCPWPPLLPAGSPAPPSTAPLGPATPVRSTAALSAAVHHAGKTSSQQSYDRCGARRCRHEQAQRTAAAGALALEHKGGLAYSGAVCRRVVVVCKVGGQVCGRGFRGGARRGSENFLCRHKRSGVSAPLLHSSVQVKQQLQPRLCAAPWRGWQLGWGRLHLRLRQLQRQQSGTAVGRLPASPAPCRPCSSKQHRPRPSGGLSPAAAGTNWLASRHAPQPTASLCCSLLLLLHRVEEAP